MKLKTPNPKEILRRQANLKFPNFKLRKILSALKNYTIFKTGGPAKIFFKAKTKEDLIEAIKTAKSL